MDEKEFKECLKIHGCESSEEGSESDSKVNLDDVYEAFKPSPTLIDPKRHTIIEVGANENSEKLSKSQKKRRRKKLFEERHKKAKLNDGVNDDEICTSEDYCEEPSSCDMPIVAENVEDFKPESITYVEEYSLDDEEGVNIGQGRNNSTKTNEYNNSVVENGTPTHYVGQGAKKKRTRRKKNKTSLCSDTTQEQNSPSSGPNVQDNQIGNYSLATIRVCKDLFNCVLIFIERNPENPLGILRTFETYLKEVNNTIGIYLTPGSSCIVHLIKVIALRYEEFLNELKGKDADFIVNQFLWDLAKIIVCIVLGESETDLLRPIMNIYEGFIFYCLGFILIQFCEMIRLMIYDKTEIPCQNPFEVVKSELDERCCNMLPFINLAKCFEKKFFQNAATNQLVAKTEISTKLSFSISPILQLGANQPPSRPILIKYLRVQNVYFNEEFVTTENRSQKLRQAFLDVGDLPQIYDRDTKSIDFNGEKLQDCVGSFCVPARNVTLIDYPIMLAMQFCDINQLVGAVIFSLLFKIMWWLETVVVYIDVICLIIFLLYFCTYFVIKF